MTCVYKAHGRRVIHGETAKVCLYVDAEVRISHCKFASSSFTGFRFARVILVKQTHCYPHRRQINTFLDFEACQSN